MVVEQILLWVTSFPGLSLLRNPYLSALIVVVIFAILAKLVLFIFSKYLQKIAKKTKTEFDDIIFEKTKGPIFYLVFAYGLKLAIEMLWVDGTLDKMVKSVMAIIFVLILSRTLDATILTWGHAVLTSCTHRTNQHSNTN